MAYKYVTGRPRVFESPDDFIKKAEAYFEENEGKRISWTGLCLAVGVESRQGLDKYKNGEHGKEFVGPIKWALSVVEKWYEENLDNAKGIFVMKNFDWKDNITQTITHETGKVSGKAEDIINSLSDSEE